jgi:sec-independent protein translocase protein TatB
MNLFGIGPLEILLVAVVAVIVLGPERFPQVAVQLARAYKWLRGYATENTRELRAEFAELTKEYEEMREELNAVRKQIDAPIRRATRELTSIAETTKTEIEGSKTDIAIPANEPIVEPGGELPPDYEPSGPAGHSDNGV